MILEQESRKTDWYKSLLIYDVGMNTGQDTDFYLKKGFRVVAIEANPALCAEVSEKYTQQVQSGRLTVLNVGIAKSKGEMDFYINSNQSEWSSFHEAIASRGTSDVLVQTIPVDTMDSVISRYGVPYYLKIDIEGNDADALESVKGRPYDIPYISVENGSTMLPILHENGYDAFKFIQQNNVHLQLQCVPPREGCATDHQFEFGASGKFGEETEGEWLNFEDVASLVSEVWDIESGVKNPNWDDGVSGWFDLHARHSDYKAIVENLIG